MAIKLQDKTNVTPPGGDYPYGSIKDNTGSNNGTPVNRNTYDDFHQFFARLLDLGSVVANGLPENSANTFQYMIALINIIVAQAATLVNAEAATRSAADTALTNDITDINAKNPNGLLWKVINIGVWNMDVNTSNAVHLTVDYSKVVDVKAFIIADGIVVSKNPLDMMDISSGVSQGGVVRVYSPSGTDTVDLFRLTGGFFDNSIYSGTGNRGTILITYLP